MGKVMGKGMSSMGKGTTRYEGVIKQFSEKKGFGFIDSPGFLAHYGKDAFLDIQDLGEFQKGDYVSFGVFWKNGRTQANDLQAWSPAEPDKNRYEGFVKSFAE